MAIQNRNYKNSPIKLTIPTLTVDDKIIRIDFDVLLQGGRLQNVAIQSCELIFSSNEIINSESAFIIADKTREKVSVTAPFVKLFLKKDIKIRITCFTKTDKLTVEYTRQSTGETMLYNISLSKMTAGEKALYQKIESKSIDKKIHEEEQEHDALHEDLESEYIIPDSKRYKNTTLSEYRNAVYREMLHLKNIGGRRHKVSNGVKISEKNGLYTYGFELEAELYLSDDAPIKLIAAGKEAEGSVIVCEDFEIIMYVEADFGDKVPSAFITVEPWKLLESLNKRLTYISKDNKIAIKLLEEGPQLGGQSAKNIAKGQAIAKEKALNSDITVIWGPPGTGKTHTMADIALHFIAKGKSILLVSHSNVSVDGVANKIVQMLSEQKKEDFIKSGKMLRYGFVRNEELQKNDYAVSFNYTLLKHPQEKERMDALLKEKERVKIQGRFSEERERIEKELKKIRSFLKDAEKSQVRKAQVVATTISKVYADKLFEREEFDVVMFDEVSMAFVPQIVCAASHAKSHFICVGDFYQLPPIVQADNTAILKKDIFSYLNITDGGLRIYGHPWLVMLDEQRRMHPDIAAFSNKYVYHNQLKNHNSVITGRTDVVMRTPFAGHAMNLLDLSGTYCAANKTADNSRFSIVHALFSFCTAITAEQNGEQSIGIITPYVAQMRLIRAMIKDYRQTANSDISCSTVHQFQGSERNVIIFDAVESYPSEKPGWLMSKEDNGSLTRLINVAVTRARGKLVTVANRSFWERKYKDGKNIFYSLVKHHQEENHVIGMKHGNLKPYLSVMYTGPNIKYYETAELSLKTVLNDIERAKSQILVSVPDSNLVEAYESKIIIKLVEAKRRGVRVDIKVREFDALSDYWKQHSYQSGEAIFPIIAIDDSIVWYDVPFANSKFVDGKYTSNTVCSAIFRITGNYTVEMIQSLTSLQNSGAEQGQIKQSGLASYVRKMAHCSDCNRAMELARNRNGTTYLKCKSCNHVEFLTKDFVEQYIRHERVRCPQHHCTIKVRLGKQGVYIQCQEGHFLRPDEI